MTNIIDVIQVANEVQNQRLQDLQGEDSTHFAEKYGKETVNVLNDLTKRTSSWFGIPQDQKNLQLSKFQLNLDEMAKTLIQFSQENEHNYASENIQVQVKKSQNEAEEFQSQNGDRIRVVKGENSPKFSVSFYGFSNFACIVDGRFDW